MSDQHDDSSHPDFRAQRPRQVVNATPPEARDRRANEKRKLGNRLRDAKFSNRAERFIDEQILEGKDWRAAAVAAGVPIRTAKVLLATPKFLTAMVRRAESLRAVEGTRNPIVLAKIRDRALAEDASAAQQKASIEAARLLEDRGNGNGPSVTVNVNPLAVVGYQIDLSGPAAEPTIGGSRQGQEITAPYRIDLDGEASQPEQIGRHREK